MKLNFALIAEESTGASAYQTITAAGHRLVAVVTSRKAAAGFGISLRKQAERDSIPIYSPKLVKDATFAQELRSLDVDIVLNVYSMGQICREVIESARWGTFNLHPGPLPENAGRNPVSWAIFEGHREHGVTLHHMAVEFDAGAIAFEERFPLNGDETAFSLSALCSKIGIDLIRKLCQVVAADPHDIPAIQQDFTKRKYHGNDMPMEGRIKWTKPAKQVCAFVRAYDFLPFRSHWGHPRACLDGQEIQIARAFDTDQLCDAPPGTVTKSSTGDVLVACSDRWLKVDYLISQESRVDAAEILQPGQRFQ